MHNYVYVIRIGHSNPSFELGIRITHSSRSFVLTIPINHLRSADSKQSKKHISVFVCEELVTCSNDLFE